MSESECMHVAINATSLLSPRTGIGKYVYRLGRELQAVPDVQPHFFYAKGWSDELRENPLPNIAGIKAGIKKYVPRAYAVSRFLSQTNFTAGLVRRRTDVYHEPNYLAFRFCGPTVITVHDLSWIRHPEMHPQDRRDAMARYFPKSLEQAAAIITDCEFVKGELIDVFGVEPSRVHPVLLGVSGLFEIKSRAQCEAVLRQHGLDHRGYFLSVGTLEPRKNIPTLVRAFSRLPAEVQVRCPLVLVGMRGWLTSGVDKEIKPLLDKGLVRLLGYVPDEQMPMLYSGAASFVFPSLYEGFGLPPLEAMACGAPVIVSNSSSLPEVVGDAAISVAPLDVEAISSAMLRVFEDRHFADDLSTRGVARAAGFTWRRTAEQTLAVYRQALSVSR